MQPSVILASTSRYRAELLQRLAIDFKQVAPECDETALPDEPAIALVERLAVIKAQSVARQFPDALVIGSDQVACLDGRILGKPGTHAAAIEQLQALSGKNVDFNTGLCVMRQADDQVRQSVETTRVTFKHLNSEQIERYLQMDKPYDCAASFRSEGYASTIVTAIESDDPCTIIGLPLIRVAEYLDQLGLPLP